MNACFEVSTESVTAQLNHGNIIVDNITEDLHKAKDESANDQVQVTKIILVHPKYKIL